MCACVFRFVWHDSLAAGLGLQVVTAALGRQLLLFGHVFSCLIHSTLCTSVSSWANGDNSTPTTGFFACAKYLA